MIVFICCIFVRRLTDSLEATTQGAAVSQRMQLPQKAASGLNQRKDAAVTNSSLTKTGSAGTTKLEDILFGFVLRRPQIERATQSAVNVMYESAAFNNVPLSYDYEDVSPIVVRCKVIFNLTISSTASYLL